MENNRLVNLYYDELMTNGIAIIPNSLEEDLINNVLTGIKEFFLNNSKLFNEFKDSNGFYPRIVNLHAAYLPLQQLFTQNKIALEVQDLFFKNSSCIYTSLYFSSGTEQPIHRDTPYFCTKPEYQYLGVWVALEDATEENGCLQIIKGAHLLNELNRDAIGYELFDNLNSIPPHSQELWNLYQSKVLEQALNAGLKIEKVPVTKGTTVIWHPQLPHGGAEILNRHMSRHSVVFHVTPPNTPVYHQDVFFNSNKIVPLNPSWKYSSYEGRKYVAYEEIDIGHKKLQKIKKLTIA